MDQTNAGLSRKPPGRLKGQPVLMPGTLKSDVLSGPQAAHVDTEGTFWH